MRSSSSVEIAHVLVEALPYIRQFAGKSVVVKLGGAAIDRESDLALAQDVLLLRSVGVRCVLVHGGGPQVDAMLRRVGKEPEFKDGLRVTDAETLEIVRMVLVGKINRDLVATINSQAGDEPVAVGVSGEDAGLLTVTPADPALGFVGNVTGVRAELIHRLLDDGLTPVISTVGANAEGHPFNVNADEAARAIAVAMNAEKIVYLTAAPGLLADVEDENSLIERLTSAELRERLTSGTVGKGMIPKLKACAEAVDQGVSGALRDIRDHKNETKTVNEKKLKVVLAYSGGLDTSIILKWLQTEYGAEVVTFTADLGQGEEVEPARRKAEMLGVKPENIFIDDLREEFVRDFVFPMFRANALYEGEYLLGTSIARPLIAKRQIEIARQVGADAVCHGATGKGNDQVRFELGYYALEPDIKVIAPWREWEFQSREALLDFAEKHQIPIAKDKRGEAPFSIDANLLHSSSEGKVLEDPAAEAPEYVHQRTISPEDAPDKATVITIDFEKGDPVAIDGEKLSPAALLTKLNQLGHDNGIGRLDLVENRFVGMKSRGVYETPGGTILLAAHRGIESITLDGGAMHLKDELMPRYASLIYNGFWFAPEREMLQAAIDKSQEHVSGRVTMKLYKGNATVIGRESDHSLYDQDLVTFEEGSGSYDHRDAAGFIRLNALRLRTIAQRDRRSKVLAVPSPSRSARGRAPAPFRRSSCGCAPRHRR